MYCQDGHLNLDCGSLSAVRIRRVVSDFESSDVRSSVKFYVEHLGLESLMDHGWIVTLIDPNNPAQQLSVVLHDETASVVPDVSFEVGDVDGVYGLAKQMGAEITTSSRRRPRESDDSS